MSTNTATQAPDVRRALGKNARHTTRNYRLGVLAGLFAGTSRDFLHPELIIAGLVYALTRSPVMVALVPIISKAGVFAPQLLVSTLVEHRPRRRPYFVMLTVARSLAMVALLGTIWLLARGVTPLALTAFFTAYLLVCMCGGAGYVIFSDMVGRLIPPGRVGSFLGARTLLGGGLAIVTGMFIIQPTLSGVELPWNYLLLAAIGTVLVVIDMSTWCLCREEPGPRAESRSGMREALARGLDWLKEDHNYRCYLLSRVAFRINYVGLAFFIPYGTERLGYESRMGGAAVLGGIMVATLKLSTVLGGVVLGKVADRHGSRKGLILSGALMLSAPLLVLLAPLLPGVFELGLPGLEQGLDLPMVVYLLALACMGAGMRGNAMSGMRFLITSAPPERRPTYVAFLNTITSPLTLLPLAGALLASLAGMTTLFTVICAGGVLSVTAALRMRPATRNGQPTA